mmetsp:Transcript_16294/g.36131  ORF Transcript_16294/g.36131 Transcript_16294/m.36131 type:complete len:107 (-) Transcript_16294:289-609(-)
MAEVNMSAEHLKTIPVDTLMHGGYRVRSPVKRPRSKFGGSVLPCDQGVPLSRFLVTGPASTEAEHAASAEPPRSFSTDDEAFLKEMVKAELGSATRMCPRSSKWWS